MSHREYPTHLVRPQMSNITFEYYCDGCEVIKVNHELVSFKCECGGSYHLLDNVQMSIFKPYYNESHNVQIDTQKAHNKFVKEKGAPIGDYKRIMDRMAFTRKNKEDIIADRYAKVGLKYPKGQNVRLDEKHMRFIPANQFGK